MLTAALRDLHTSYPGEYLTDVRTPCPDLWLHNPYLTPLEVNEEGTELVECSYPIIHQSNQKPVHFLHGFSSHLGETLGVPLLPTEFRGDIHLSEQETSEESAVARILGNETPYWIVAAGGKYDYTIKWWHPERWQEVVDCFRGELLFVQVGEEGHFHPQLEGVLDLRGKTSIRDLVYLMHYAEGVLCPVTFLMHLAAAVETRPGCPVLRPCVVIAGGREGPHWEAYPGHQFLHRVGTLPCCSHGGCWRSRTVPLEDGDEKDNPNNLCVDVYKDMPHCMEMIAPKHVVSCIRDYIDGGACRQLTKSQFISAGEHLTGDPLVPVKQREHSRSSLLPDSRPSAAICVLLFGDYPQLAMRVFESIEEHVPRADRELIVGANAIGAKTVELVDRLQHEGQIDSLIHSSQNVNKCTMMRRMLREVNAEYVWWFDDDSYIKSSSALMDRLCIAREAPQDTVMWGQAAFCESPSNFTSRSDVSGFVKTAHWCRGLRSPADELSKEGQRWRFILGGGWFIRTSALRRLNWPDPRLRKEGDDVFLGEAIRQQGWKIQDIGELGVSIDQERRRGDVGF